MKKIITCVLIISFLSSCKKTSNSLLDYMGISQLNVAKTPESLVQKQIKARLNEKEDIYGYSDVNIRYYSEDNFINTTTFNSVEVNDAYNNQYELIYDKEGVVIFYIYKNDNTMLIKSEDNGKTFSDYAVLNGYNHTSDVFILNENIGYYLSRSCPLCYTSEYFSLYKIISGQVNLVSTTQVQYFEKLLAVHFINESIGYALLGNSNTGSTITTIKTIDGGVTWGLENRFNNSNASNYPIVDFVALSEDVLLSVGGNGTYYYLSEDAGQNWEFVQPNDLLNGKGNTRTSDIQFLNENIGYLVTTDELLYNDKKRNAKGYLYKTINGGEAWEKVTENLIYSKNVFFLNENVGIVTAEGIIQKTTDGGKAFELLMYPLEE